MKKVNIYEAKTHLSSLVNEAAAGEEIVISRAGKPVVKLVPVGRVKRKLGLLKGKWKVPLDFDAPLPEDIQASFEKG